MNCLKQCLLFPKFNCGCGLVTLALALASSAHGADLELIGQWPGWPRGNPRGVAVSGNYAYVADEAANDFVPKPSSGMKFGEPVEVLRGRWLT